MGKRILSEQEMAQLEANQEPTKRVLSDQEMQALEAQHAHAGTRMDPIPVPESEYIRHLIDSTHGKADGKIYTNQDMDNYTHDLINGMASAVPAGKAFAPVQKAGSYLAQKTGANRLADFLMQKASGLKKYVPGTGNTLIQEGLMGTKGALQNQVKEKLLNRGEQLNELVGQIKTPISGPEVSEGLKRFISKFKTPAGITPEAVQGELGAVNSRMEDISQRGGGQVSPQEALELKRIAQNEGYRQGRPLASLDAKLAQAEAGSYGNALEQNYAKDVGLPEGVENPVASTNEKLSALLKAKKGLTDPESIKKGIPLTDLAFGNAGSMVAGGVIGAASEPEDRLEGIAKGVLVSQALKSKLLQSLAAQGLYHGGEGLSSALGRPTNALIGNMLYRTKQGEDQEGK